MRSRRKLGFEALDVRARPLLTVDGNLGVAWTDPKLEDPSFRRSLISLISVRHACRRRWSARRMYVSGGGGGSAGRGE